MSQGPVQVDSARIARMIDQQEIADVVYRYCRGLDRCDMELVRSCFHPDGTDDHGDKVRGMDEFVAYVEASLGRYQCTLHFIGNVLVAPVGDRARAESYLVAYHRLNASGSKPERDYVVGMRYVDDFERRDGEWRIATRVCAFEWSRIDPVAPANWVPSDRATVGRRDQTDVVFAPTLAGWAPNPAAR